MVELARLEGGDEDGRRAALEQLLQLSFARVQGLVPEIPAAGRHQVEGIELRFLVSRFECRTSKSQSALHVGDANLAVDDELRSLQLQRRSTIHEKATYSVQSGLRQHLHLFPGAHHAAQSCDRPAFDEIL